MVGSEQSWDTLNGKLPIKGAKFYNNENWHFNIWRNLKIFSRVPRMKTTVPGTFVFTKYCIAFLYTIPGVDRLFCSRNNKKKNSTVDRNKKLFFFLIFS